LHLIIASSNAGKRREIAPMFGELGITIVPAEQTRFVDVPEDGESFADNARGKARAFVKANGLPALADDSGLTVQALSGAPGIYSSRYAGEAASDTDNNRKLLRQMQGVRERGARFVCFLHLAFPGNEAEAVTAEGSVEGVILDKPDGESGFGYDPLFYCPELGKSFGRATAIEKARVSHRARALQVMVEKLASRLRS